METGLAGMGNWVLVIVTMVYATATIFICIYNYRLAKATREQVIELKRQYDSENRPYITVELIYVRKAFYGLRLTNHGKRIANHVSICLSQEFIESIAEQNFKSELEKTKGKECIIGIGEHYELFFGTNEFRDNPNKIPISGYVTYSDIKERFRDEFFIDFKIYATAYAVDSDADDLLNAMKKQTQELKDIESVLARMASYIKKNNNVVDEIIGE